MDLRLQGKRAIVTGGSRGIGKVIARHLAEEGVDVAIIARDLSRVEASAAELSELSGRRVVGFVGDTGDDKAITAAVEAAVQALGGVDILVNNAAQPGGVAPAAKLAEVVDDYLLADVNIKVSGYLRTARAVVPLMVAQGWGRIINIGGLAARRSGNYIASVRNAAVSSITKNLADEFGPKGINVTAIHPGATRTEKTDPAAEARLAANTSIGRIVDASEIAWLVIFFASPRSVAINGETIAAGGGTTGVINY